MYECYICNPIYDIGSEKPNRMCDICRLVGENKNLKDENEKLRQALDLAIQTLEGIRELDA